MIELGHCDVGASEACQRGCVSCSHASPFMAPYSMTPEELERDLSIASKFVHFHRIQMVGGEPTLNKQLPELMRVARKSGIAREVMVITNGGLLRRMPEEFWKELDSLQLSIYPGLDADIPEFAKTKCAYFGKAFFSTTYTHFHKQFRETPNDGSHFSTCHWKSDCYTIHRGYFFLCPQSTFFPRSFMDMPHGTDGLPLNDSLTEAAFDAFLNRKEPLNACRICMANEMKSRPWAEAKRSEWLEKSKAV